MADESLILNPHSGDKQSAEEVIKELHQLLTAKGYTLKSNARGMILAKIEPDQVDPSNGRTIARIVAYIDEIRPEYVRAHTADWANTPDSFKRTF